MQLRNSNDFTKVTKEAKQMIPDSLLHNTLNTSLIPIMSRSKFPPPFSETLLRR